MTKTVQLVEGGHLLYATDYDPTEPDIFVYDGDYHNGPGCALCFDAWCHHCYPDRDTEKCPDLEEPGLFDAVDYADVHKVWEAARD